MKVNVTKEELIAFEEEIAERFKNKEISAPVHLQSGGLDELIFIFEKYINENDYILGTWRNHIPCLLKGVPPETLIKAILNKQSIHLNFSQYKILSSGIVGGIFPIAVGIALGIKLKNDNNKVWVIAGDMSFTTGIARESLTYASNYSLPIGWICQDNNLSVCTNTRECWGSKKLWFEDFEEKENLEYNITYYKILNLFHFRYSSSYPHVNIKNRVQF